MSNDDQWMRLGRCHDGKINPEIFFLKRGALTENTMKINRAKAICHDCPVRLECLKYSIAHNIKDGIWGGMTIHERRRYFPKSVRERIKEYWFRSHPGARPLPPPSSYAPRSKRGGDSSKEEHDDYLYAG